ncbi:MULTISPECIES: hypothetical protein [unclassified Streptomyces]|uniref:hypothetical protein n=1 Tax=unclassified Streptomyces TaxID=2593676 RepID=UPI00115FB8B4|nr:MULTISPECIES: hypothetical protein [unclassified Streptomyces]
MTTARAFPAVIPALLPTMILALVVVLTGVGASTGTARADSARFRTTTAAAAAPATHRAVAPSQPAPAPPDVVQTYFNVINDRDFVAAWAIGGRQHIAGRSYDAFVASFNTVSKFDVTIVSVQGTKVAVKLDATQTDKSHRHYAGTYTVVDGVIVAADIHPK